MDTPQIQEMVRRAERSLRLLEAAQLDLYGYLGLTDPRDLQAELDGWGFYPHLAPPYYRQSQKRGEVLPIYTTESQLRVIRDRSRRLAAENEFAISAIENRKSYVVGKGFTYTATARFEGVTPALVGAAQRVIDGFVEANEMSELEQDSMGRLDVDGEVILRLFPGDCGILDVRTVEPEHLKAPLGEAYGPAYSFGVQTPPQDVETPLGYWITEDPQRDSNPVFVPADEIIHVKLNTARNAKRGLPTFYPIESNLRRAEDLLASMTSMAKTRAKVAMIRHMDGIAKSAAQSLLDGLTEVQATDPGTGATLNLERLRFGSVLNSSKSITYEFPNQQISGGEFVAVLQAELRSCAARVVMPEWMFTADASNQNRASALIAGDPSTRNFERLQALLTSRFGVCRYRKRRSLVWRQLAHAVRVGILPQDVFQCIDVQVEAPTLVIREKKDEAETNQTYYGMGVKSITTIQQELGLDPDQERRNQATEKGATPDKWA